MRSVRAIDQLIWGACLVLLQVDVLNALAEGLARGARGLACLRRLRHLCLVVCVDNLLVASIGHPGHEDILIRISLQLLLQLVAAQGLLGAVSVGRLVLVRVTVVSRYLLLVTILLTDCAALAVHITALNLRNHLLLEPGQVLPNLIQALVLK